MERVNIYNSDIMTIWKKAQIIPGYSPDSWRRDINGNPMKFLEYGNRECEYGWEIRMIENRVSTDRDPHPHIQPLALVK